MELTLKCQKLLNDHEEDDAILYSKLDKKCSFGQHTLHLHLKFGNQHQ